MLIALLVGGVLFGYLAVDAWCLRSNHKLPFALLAKLRGYPTQVHTAQSVERARIAEGRLGVGNTNFTFVALALVSLGFFIAAGVLLLE